MRTCVHLILPLRIARVHLVLLLMLVVMLVVMLTFSLRLSLCPFDPSNFEWPRFSPFTRRSEKALTESCLAFVERQARMRVYGKA
jgi:hypothetical protein